MSLPQESESTYLLGGIGILFDAPTMSEAVGQLENGEDKLSLRSSTLLHARLESHLLNRRRIGGCSGKILDGTLWIWRTTPSVSVQHKSC